MTMPSERETSAVERPARGPGGLIIALVVLVAILGIAYLVFANNFGGPDAAVTTDVPTAATGVVPESP